MNTLIFDKSYTGSLGREVRFYILSKRFHEFDNDFDVISEKIENARVTR